MLKRQRPVRSWPALPALFLIWLTAGCQPGPPPARQTHVARAASPSTMSFLVSMEEPASNRLRVVFRYEGVEAEAVELKMPAWTPGYYRILNFAGNVADFKAEDGNGRPLDWEKSADNAWKVKTAGAGALIASYEVLARGRGVAESQLTEKRAYISPTGVFMFVSGKLDHPVIVSVRPPRDFRRISTGLEPVKGRENTFCAEDFDVLYDCPIYVGNQQVLAFDVDRVPYELALEDLSEADKDDIIAALKRIIRAATNIIGKVPYKRYVFIMMGEGMGGLEHRNSMAVFSRLPGPGDPAGRRRWSAFIAHEFFHLYNVKAVRPVALGPFDYEKENRTNMLWFSEGGTVYYEYIILNRAGLMGRDEVLEAISRLVGKVENSAGRITESAAQASYNTWTEPFFGSDKTISYYDLGAVLTMLLDLEIRHATDSRKTLDDVMRILYRRFYKEQKRGFTDEEFRQVCEEAAGTVLSEFFDYVYSTKAMDYDKYLGYAGLKLEVDRKEGGPSGYAIKPREGLDERRSRLLDGWLR